MRKLIAKFLPKQLIRFFAGDASSKSETVMSSRSKLKHLYDELFEIAAEWRGTYDLAVTSEYREIVHQLMQIDEWDGYIGYDLRILHKELIVPPELLEKYGKWHIFNPNPESPTSKDTNPEVAALIQQVEEIRPNIRRSDRNRELVNEYMRVFAIIAESEFWDGSYDIESYIPPEELSPEFLNKYPRIHDILSD